MEIKEQKVYELIGRDFRGNTAEFCRALKLSYTTVWRALNHRSAGNSKFIPALSTYCREHGLSVTDYLMF